MYLKVCTDVETTGKTQIKVKVAILRPYVATSTGMESYDQFSQVFVSSATKKLDLVGGSLNTFDFQMC